MSFADCTACLWKHKHPVNTKCEYTKLAVEICMGRRISSSHYMDYLPDLVSEDILPSKSRTKSGGTEPLLGNTAGARGGGGGGGATRVHLGRDV